MAVAGPGAGKDNNPASVFAKLWAKQSFTATATFSFEGGQNPGMMPGGMEMKLAVSGGRSRMDIDMSKMAVGGGAGPAGMMPGLEKMTTITFPDKKMMYQIMPGLKAYCEMAIPDSTGDSKENAPKIERKVEGAEKIGDYSCEKVRNTITAKGEESTIITWEAKELGGIAVKMVADIPAGGKMTMLLKNIKTEKPDESLFAPPSGYTKYNSMQEMMMSLIKQSMP
jgi:hypothetical protein